MITKYRNFRLGICLATCPCDNSSIAAVELFIRGYALRLGQPRLWERMRRLVLACSLSPPLLWLTRFAVELRLQSDLSRIELLNVTCIL